MRARPTSLACAALLTLLTLVAAPGLARAEGTGLRADLVEAKAIKLDGVPKEWGSLVKLTHAVKGTSGKPDLEARAGLAYDGTSLYVGADVTDDVLRPGADKVSLALGFPGGVVYEVDLFPGDPGKSPGAAKLRDGTPVAGARVVEAPKSGGYTLEASLPWSAFAPARTTRVGLRAALFVHDADASNAVEAIVGTAPSASWGALPPLTTEPEQALAEGLLHDKGLHGAPRFDFVADVVGDAMKERVLVYDRYLVVLGPSFRKGKEYYYADLGVDPAAGMLPFCDVRDLTGDGQAEIVLRKRFGAPGRFREVLQVLSFGAGDVPAPIFQHEVGLTTDAGSVVNDVAFLPDGPRVAVRISPGAAKGFNAGTYHEATETSFDPLLLPWGSIQSQTYKVSGSGFAKASEEKQAPTAPPPSAPAAAEASLPRAPPPPSGAELMERVYDLYKRDRGATGRPRFDLAADVAGDGQPERVLVHDRDLVVFGKGFKGGTGYTYLTMSLFASPGDITEVTARDLTGDGKADVIVKGVLHAPAPKDAGGGTVDREVVLVFQLASDVLRRVFAAEVARSMGRKRVAESFQLVPSGRGADIALGPGTAVEWTEKTYPFNQDTTPVGGLEPLLLPWGSSPVRYRWTGSGFSRRD